MMLAGILLPNLSTVQTAMPFCNFCTGILPSGVSIKVFSAKQIGQGLLLSVFSVKVAILSLMLVSVSVMVHPLLALSPICKVIGCPLVTAIGYSLKFVPVI